MSQLSPEFEELRITVERLRAMLEGLIVRGLRACGSDELAQLASYIDFLDKAGASHVAGVLTDLRGQIEKDDRTSARTLLSAQTSVRLLERLLTLRVVTAQYAMARRRAMMTPNDRKQLLTVLDELSRTIEELLLAGLTAASKSTVERLDVSFKEASRLRLLRLGSTLRIANEEISRFTSGSALFSSRRLAFFLGRAWLLAAAMGKAINANDDAALNKLMATEPTQPAEKVRVVTIGVTKRVVPGAFASFDFRLRNLDTREPMIWSVVFPMRLDLPAEAFLHLPQKQKFKPSVLLEKKVIDFTRCGVVKPTTGGPTRIVLGDASQVTAAEPFNDWQTLFAWDAAASAGRLAAHKPTPLDLEIELQEEIFVDGWDAGKPIANDAGYDTMAVAAQKLTFEIRLDKGPSGVPATKMLTTMATKKTRPPLYGVAHYESCRLVFQPLTALSKDGPEYLTVSPDKISQAELVKAMKFT